MNRLWLVCVVACLACGRDNALVDGECAAGYELVNGSCVAANDGMTRDADASRSDATIEAASDDAPAPTDAPADAITDSSTCDDGLTLCDGTCVDTSTDPFNCGACGIVCPSLLCQVGQCQGQVPGSFVVVGHDFGSSYSAAQAKTLGNALLLSPAANIRVRSYEQYAVPAAVASVKTVLNAAGSGAGRTVTYTVATTPSDVSPGMSALNTDVLLIYDQRNAPANTLAAIAAGWMTTISNFAHVGGIVIVLDGGGGPHPQMPGLIQNAGILDVTGDTSIQTGTPLTVVAPADAVGLGVVSPYGAVKDSVYFTCNDPNGGAITYVVEDLGGDAGAAQPVVVHRIAP